MRILTSFHPALLNKNCCINASLATSSPAIAFPAMLFTNKLSKYCIPTICKSFIRTLCTSFLRRTTDTCQENRLPTSSSQSDYLRENFTETQTKTILEILNAISQSDLAAIKKVGKTRASKIIEYRDKIGNTSSMSESETTTVDRPFKNINDLLRIKGLGLVHVASVSQAIVEAFEKKEKKKKSTASLTKNFFCIPPLSKSDVFSIKSWITLDLQLDRLIWIKFARYQQHRVTPHQHDSADQEDISTGEREKAFLVERWDSNEIGFSESDLRSKYHHARCFKLLKTLLERLPKADAYFMLELPITPNERNPKVQKATMQLSFMEGVVVASLCEAHAQYPTSSHNFRQGVNVFKIKPMSVAKHFSISVGGEMADPSPLTTKLIHERKDIVVDEDAWLNFLRTKREVQAEWAKIFLTALFVLDNVKGLRKYNDVEEQSDCNDDVDDDVVTDIDNINDI